MGDVAAPPPTHKKKTAQSAAAAAAAADVISISIPAFSDKSITVGPVRHKLCNPLLKGLDGQESLWEGIGRAIESPSLTAPERMAAWDGIGVVGEIARISCELDLPRIARS